MSETNGKADRNIYEWHDGEKPRKSDPAVIVQRIYRAMHDRGIDMKTLDAQLAVANAPIPRDDAQADKDFLMGLEAQAGYATIAYAAFDAKPLADDGSGWTQGEACERLRAFMQWADELQKKPNGSPI